MILNIPYFYREKRETLLLRSNRGLRHSLPSQRSGLLMPKAPRRHLLIASSFTRKINLPGFYSPDLFVFRFFFKKKNCLSVLFFKLLKAFTYVRSPPVNCRRNFIIFQEAFSSQFKKHHCLICLSMASQQNKSFQIMKRN